METDKIKWSIGRGYGPNSFMLIGDYNGVRFVEKVLDSLWGLPMLYKKWVIKRKFKILNK